MKIKQSPTCNFCTAIDDICHFFIYCADIKNYWVSFYDWFNRANNAIVIQLDLPHDEFHILFGYASQEDVFQVLNYCILYSKYYILRQRLYGSNSVDIQGFLRELKYNMNIEKVNINGIFNF